MPQWPGHFSWPHSMRFFNRQRRRCLLMLCLLGSAFGASSTFAATEIVAAEFGLFDAGQPGELVFTPSERIPLKTGQRYGWVIEVRTSQRSLMVREEYLLPSKAPIYAPAEGTRLDAALTIQDTRRHQVSERRLVPVDGKIFGEWAIGENEPAGTRSLMVIVEGAAETRFDYQVAP